MFRILERHWERGLGLPYPVLLLKSAEEEVDGAGAPVGVRVPNVEGLAAAVAVARCLWPGALAGAEVRFLRRTMRLQSRELAGMLETTPETVSRWQTGSIRAGARLDKALRLLAAIRLQAWAPAMDGEWQRVIFEKVEDRAEDEWPWASASLSRPDGWVAVCGSKMARG